MRVCVCVGTQTLRVAIAKYRNDQGDLGDVLCSILVCAAMAAAQVELIPWPISTAKLRRGSSTALLSGLTGVRKRKSATMAHLPDIFEPVELIQHTTEASAAAEYASSTSPDEEGSRQIVRTEAQDAKSVLLFKRSKVVEMYSLQRSKVYPFELSKLWEGRPGCPEPQYVLIFGAPGIGKSTYLSMVQYEWATGGGRDLWDGCFKYLIKIEVRDVECDPMMADVSIAELLWKHGIATSDVDIPLGDFARLLDTDRSKFCLLIDGLEDFHGNCNALQHLLVGQPGISEKLKVIVTSQPCDLFQLVADHVDTKVELLGFGKASIKAYTEKYLKEMKRMRLQVNLALTPYVNS